MADRRDTFRQGISTPSLLNATSEELTSGLSDYRFTSVDLVVVRLVQLLDGHPPPPLIPHKAYSKRIEDVNSTLKSVMEINPDALLIAATLDDERRKGTLRG